MMPASIPMRLAGAVATILAVSLLMFAVVQIGSDPLQQLQNEGGYDRADLDRIRSDNGWDDPWLEQYGAWVTGFVQGDWGNSLRTNGSARELILERMPVTLILAGSSLLLALLISVPLSVLLALRRGDRLDRFFTTSTFALLAVPGFMVAVLLQLLAVQLRDVTGQIVFFTGGMPLGGSWFEFMQRYTLPVIALTTIQVAVWVRFQRGELITALGAEHVRAAHAKGIAPRTVHLRHALRGSLAPLVVLAGIDIAQLLSGAVIVETVFGLPGMGRLLLESVQSRDTVVALDLVVLAALAMVVAAAAADLLQRRLDPRSQAS